MRAACADLKIVSPDHGKDDSGGWVEMLDGGTLTTLRGKTGWREVEIGRGSSAQTCLVQALTSGCISPASTSDPFSWLLRVTG